MRLSTEKGPFVFNHRYLSDKREQCPVVFNPIEHVWDIMERRLRREYPNLINSTALERALQQIWNTIPQLQFARCISMVRRLRTVIESRGDHVITVTPEIFPPQGLKTRDSELQNAFWKLDTIFY
ncbi:hypothetical protein PV325_007655 [Microctonus aethiopoides]|nr:hypothetical protein PV325_007655 [Microctonus aethiopoides]